MQRLTQLGRFSRKAFLLVESVSLIASGVARASLPFYVRSVGHSVTPTRVQPSGRAASSKLGTQVRFGHPLQNGLLTTSVKLLSGAQLVPLAL
jgi:hypothetical protein